MEMILKTGMEVKNVENDENVYPKGEDAKSLCEQVNKKLDDEGESANLAEYLYVDAITAAYPRAEFRDNEAAGIVKLTLTRELTDTELEEVKNNLSGQFSDGWGESFDTNEFKAGDITVYIYFTI